MKKYILALALALLSAFAVADYKLIIPQSPGQGTSVWGSIIAKELEKALGEKIVLVHIPGANDIPGFNKFHNELQKDSKTIMLGHGGNGESYLIHQVDYEYRDYDPIGLQNLTIVVGHRKDSNPFDGVKFAYSSGTNPDMLSITMMACGPKARIEEYKKCYNEKVKYVKGMKGNERGLAYLRGELNVTRETPATYMKHYMKPEFVLWYSAGVLNLKTGKVVADSYPVFEEVFKAKWGVYPSGEFYEMYLLVKHYRDVLQKSLWVSKNNPNTKALRQALTKMLTDPESVAAIEKETGKYLWLIGNDVSIALRKLEDLTTKKALKNLVVWNSTVFNQEAFYKENIAKKAK
jgi:hypothetical protein